MGKIKIKQVHMENLLVAFRRDNEQILEFFPPLRRLKGSDRMGQTIR